MHHASVLLLAINLGISPLGAAMPQRTTDRSAAQGTPPAHGPAINAAEATRLFQAGSAAFNAHDLKSAHADFARLTRLAPQVAAAHSAFGAVLLAEYDYAAAVTELKQARRLDPHDTQALINLGVAECRMGEFAEATAAFRALAPTERASLQPPETLAFATALADTGERATAEALLREATAAQPSAELADALGALQAQDGQYEAARAQFAEALRLNPGLASAHAHAGSLLLRQGDAQGALAELQRAVSSGDSSPVTQLELGQALSASGHDAEALSTLRKALAANPGSLEVQYALALALQGAGDAKEALPLFAKVTAARPNDAAALTNHALALVQTGDARSALPLYARAAALDPHNITLCEDRGVAFLQLNDLDPAIEQFQAGLRLDADNALLHYDLGLAYKLKDDLPRAVQELERAETLDPGLPDPAYTLGVIRMQQGDAAEAVRHLQRAVALRPDNADAWGLLGSEEKDAGNLDAALDALHHAIALAPYQPSSHITLAAVLTAKGDRGGALAERKAAADLSRKAMSRQRADFALQSGRALLAKGDIAGAIVQFNDAIAAQPDQKDAHLLLAEALQKQGRPADALAERQRAEHLPVSPQSP